MNLLRLRKNGESQQSTRRVGLVIEGGAMRGALSGAAGVAFYHSGLFTHVDAVYATSAGAMTGAYLLSDQPDIGITIYYEDLICKWFMNPYRPWKFLDLDALFSRVIRGSKRLDLQALSSDRRPLCVTSMETYTGKAAVLTVSGDEQRMLDVLRAAMAIPVLYPSPVTIDGVSYVDGGMRAPIPTKAAIDDGCTDLIVLTSQAMTYQRKEPSRFSRAMMSLYQLRKGTHVRAAYRRYHTVDRRIRAWLASADDDHINRLVIAPSDHYDSIHRTTSDPALMKRAIEAHCKDVQEALGKYV